MGLSSISRIYSSRRSVSAALLYTLSLAKSLRRLIAGYDLVEFNMSPMLHLALLGLAKRYRRGSLPLFVGALHEVWQEYWLGYAGWAEGLVGYAIERYSAAGLDHIITISEFNRRKFARWGVPREKVSVIRPGVDFRKVTRALPNPSSPDLVYLGRMVREKRPDLAIKALAELKHLHGLSPRLAMVGDGPRLGQLRSLAKSLGVGEQVTLLGRIEDDQEVYSLLCGARALVYPAAPEGGWSIAFLEANAAGIPVVTSQSSEIGTSREMISEGKNGFAAVEPVPALYAEKIEAALEANRDGRLSSGCREFAKKFEWESICGQTEQLYEELIDRKQHLAADAGSSSRAVNPMVLPP